MGMRMKKIVLGLIVIGVTFSIQGLGKFLKTQMIEGSQRIKQVPLPKKFEPHKRMLIEPWQPNNPIWRKETLLPTVGSVAQSALWASLSYAIGMPIYVIRPDNIAYGLRKSWEYLKRYIDSSTQNSLPVSAQNISEKKPQEKIDE